MSERRERRTLLILYILAAYILFQLGWWGYLQISLTKELFEETGRPATELTRKVWMIIGEGIVFFMLLFVGFVYVRRTVVRELRLARMEKTFLLSVTHELKTPIAAVKLMLDSLKRGKLEKVQETEVIDDALRETRRLETLTENILLATRLDQQRGSFNADVVDVSACAEQCVRNMQRSFGNRHRFEADIAEGASLSGDEQLVRALLQNLLENAVKYSPVDTAISIRVRQQHPTVTLEVSDRGTGIPAEERERVFEKFYRLGNEETRRHKGTGLGLYLVRTIAKLHGGHARVEQRMGGGSTFVVQLNHLKA